MKISKVETVMGRNIVYNYNTHSTVGTIAVVFVYWAKKEFAPLHVLFLAVVLFDTNDERNVHFHPPDLQTTVLINFTLSDLSFFNSWGRLKIYQFTKLFIISSHFALTKLHNFYSFTDFLEVGADVDDAGREVALSNVGH